MSREKGKGKSSEKKCHNCGKPGHLARDCRVKKEKGSETENAICWKCGKMHKKGVACPDKKVHKTTESEGELETLSANEGFTQETEELKVSILRLRRRLRPGSTGHYCAQRNGSRITSQKSGKTDTRRR